MKNSFLKDVNTDFKKSPDEDFEKDSLKIDRQSNHNSLKKKNPSRVIRGESLLNH